MRVTLISSRFPPQRCGVGDYTYFLACALARLGHQVTVLTSLGGLDPKLYPLPPSVDVLRVVKSWTTPSLLKILDHVRKTAPDRVLLQYVPHAFDRRGITFAVNLMPALLRYVARFHVGTNFHELYIPFDRSLLRSLGSLWQRAMVVLLSLGSQALTVTTSDWRRSLRRLGVDKDVAVIPVGSNVPLKEVTEGERNRLRSQYLDNADCFLLAAFGAQHDRDVPAALHALKELKACQPAKLIWIGGKSSVERFQRNTERAMCEYGLGENDVIWVERLPHPNLSALLGACDTMVLPFTDGISTRRTTAVTALQHGLPVLSTRTGRTAPCFVHGKNVYLAPARDKQALAEGLIHLARHPEVRVRLAKGGRALYETHFSWDLIAEQVAGATQPYADTSGQMDQAILDRPATRRTM